MRRLDRLAEHDGGVDAGGRSGLQEAAGHRLRSRRAHHVPGDLRVIGSAVSGWGIQTADFIVSKLPKGGKVLALRILPGVDVLETRWSAASRIFKEHGVNVVGAEFTGGDNAKTKQIVEDYINKNGKIDAVWMDAGATAVAALEAFEDPGQPYPIITGEDQEDFLKKWKEKGLTAMASKTHPTYQWRAPVIAAVKVPKGEPVIGPTRKLPQPVITQGPTSTSTSTTRCRPCIIRHVRPQGPSRLSAALGRQVRFKNSSRRARPPARAR